MDSLMTSIPLTNAVTTLRNTAKYPGIAKKSIPRDSIGALTKRAPDIFIYIYEQLLVGVKRRVVL